MKSVSLANYILRINRMYSQTDELVDGFGDGVDLYDILLQLFATLKDSLKNADKEKLAFQISKLESSNRIITGIVECGEYGAEGHLKDVKTGQRVHEKQESHADMMRYYFLISLPKNRTKGVMLLQRVGAEGVAGVLHSALESEFALLHPEYRIKFTPFTTVGIMAAVVARSEVKKVRFVRYTIPDDYADAIGSGHGEKNGTMELIIKPYGFANRSLHQRLVDAMRKPESRLGDIINLTDDRFEPQEVKFELEYGGKRRTLRFKNILHSMRGEFDISEDVDWRSGHPTFASLDRAARRILAEVEVELYKKAEGASG